MMLFLESIVDKTTVPILFNLFFGGCNYLSMQYVHKKPQTSDTTIMDSFKQIVIDC